MDEIQYSHYNPISIIRQLIKGIILVLFVVISLSVFYQVVSRYIFQAPLSNVNYYFPLVSRHASYVG